MQLSVRSVLAIGVSLTVAAGILSAPTTATMATKAPQTADPAPVLHSASVALTGAWQDLGDHTEANLANLSQLITHYPTLPILTQLASNQATYARWLAGQDGGSPELVARTVAQHLVTVGVALGTFSLLMPLSLVGAFISPAVTALYLVQATGRYPSTPQTWLQAFLDAPAVYLDTTLNCCTTPLFKAAFGLLNPGPAGLLLSLPMSIATALSIPPPSWVGALDKPATAAGPAAPAAPSLRRTSVGSGLAQSRRTQPAAGADKSAAARSTTRRAAVAKDAADTARGKGRSARPVKPGSPGTR